MDRKHLDRLEYNETKGRSTEIMEYHGRGTGVKGVFGRLLEIDHRVRVLQGLSLRDSL